MRLTAFDILLFFVALNVAIYLINETAILPYWQQSPYETPTGIQGKLAIVDLSTGNLILSGVTLGVVTALGWITGHLIFGGTVAIFLAALNLVSGIVSWIIFGFPKFLAQMGVPDVVWGSLAAMMSVVWFWFFLGFLAQRPMETD